ncbi:MAG TPA: serine/threonine-protein kinase [Actinospica sp.]|jgi:serine/threonine protein kinase|nr:serine/threonine-protein kinase [Actinospica sp.]
MDGAPSKIGRYTVERPLGSGGMGEVFLAYSPAGEPVAVKLIRADRLDPETRKRFEREAHIARGVVGTSRVARFLDADPFADRPWMAVEYISGPTLDESIGAGGTWADILVASMGALLSDGLEAIHRAKLLHRDLKPQNIILGESGPVIIDFGLAAFADASSSLSRSGTIIGSVRCMPPEQAAGKSGVTPAADVYGLGTVLLYAATGHYPYDGATWQAITAQVASADAKPDLNGLPAALAPLVRAMLEHEPENRPTTADVQEMCAELLTARGWSPVQARRELIRLTARPVEQQDPAFAISASVEARIDAEAMSMAAKRGDSAELAALDHADAEREREEPVADEPAAPEPGDAAKPVRPAASTRVAQELRRVYAAAPSL